MDYKDTLQGTNISHLWKGKNHLPIYLQRGICYVSFFEGMPGLVNHQHSSWTNRWILDIQAGYPTAQPAKRPPDAMGKARLWCRHRGGGLSVATFYTRSLRNSCIAMSKSTLDIVRLDIILHLRRQNSMSRFKRTLPNVDDHWCLVLGIQSSTKNMERWILPVFKLMFLFEGQVHHGAHGNIKTNIYFNWKYIPDTDGFCHF